MLDFLREHTTIQFWVLFLILTWAFHYIYKSSNRFANGNYENSPNMVLPDIFIFIISVAIIFEFLPAYREISRIVSTNDAFQTLIVPFPLYFIALYPITKNTVKFFKDHFNK